MTIKAFLRPIKIFRLVSQLLTYAMGAGLAHYFEARVAWSVLLAGAVFVCFSTLGFDYLQVLQQVNDGRFQPEDVSPKDILLIRMGLGLISGAMMTVAVTVIVGWMIKGVLWPGSTILLVAVFAVGGVYILEGTVEKLRPFHSLFETVLVVIIPPALGYFLQTQDMHRFLTFAVLGIVPIYLAFILLTQLIHYGEDQQKEALTTVTAIGWEPAMVIHNALILSGFLLFALAALLGFPWPLIWPVFLTLPLGLLEIWLMERVRQGQKPLWRIMQYALGAAFLIPVYLLALGFWLR
jgi:1,4-dihydroxy-2-naphthoate octaprenyltransferase